MSGAPVDSLFFTDGYPREGCVASVDVRANGYALSIHAPGGQCIERYAPVHSADDICRMLREWLSGSAPRLSQTDCQHRYACMKRRVDLARADELLAKVKQLENRASAISALEAISLRAEAQMLRVQSRCACLPSRENADLRGSCCEPAKVSSDA